MTFDRIGISQYTGIDLQSHLDRCLKARSGGPSA